MAKNGTAQPNQGISNIHANKLGVSTSAGLSAPALQDNGSAEYVIQFILLVKLLVIVAAIEFNIWVFSSTSYSPRWVFPRSTYATVFGVFVFKLKSQLSILTFF